jgi:hypothetical protein
MKLLCALLIAAAVSSAQEPYSKLRATGPLTLAIAYRCNPDQRANLRQRMVAGGVARFERWKNDGVFENYHILFNSYLDSETYDMLTLLTFSKYSDGDRWREIERTMPGGLSQDILPLITSAVTYSLDGLRQASSNTAPKRGQSVFFLIPYDYVVSTDDYVKYLDTYVIPQVTGWIGEGVLGSYTIYLSRYSTSRPWGSLFVLEYRDWEAFGKREATVAKVREKLKSNPPWLAASENKQKIRVEGRTMIAEELLP